jgi:CRISPR/Cas system-associated endoribonuclease Cas2
LAAKGIRIQKSVFLVQASRNQARELVQALSAEIDPATDSVCAWPLSESWQAQQHVYPAEAAPLQEIYVVA